MDKIIKVCVAGLTAAITYLFGGVDAIMGIVLVFIALDYLTGILAAIYTKTLSSEAGYKGIIKKVGILCVIAAGNLLGQSVGVETIRSLVIGFYIANEGISILENTGRMGIPYPEKIMEVLAQLKNNKKQ